MGGRFPLLHTEVVCEITFMPCEMNFKLLKINNKKHMIN